MIDITKFKNDKERIAFLEDYHNMDNGWYLWMAVDAINRNWYRFDLSESSLVVEEQLMTYQWPKPHETYTVIHWYIVRNWKAPFADNVASRTMALAELKESQKIVRMKGEENESCSR